MEENSFNSSNSFGFEFETIDPNETKWNELISEIEKGNVIPVIGPDLLREKEDGKNYHQFIISKIAQMTGVKSNPNSFSQLLYDPNFKSFVESRKWNHDSSIYAMFLPQTVKWPVTPHPLLKRLIETKKFPFIITTSFTNVVEKCMMETYGEDNVRVLQFNNDSQRSMQIGFGDVLNEKELKQPTVFYMFGKVCKEPHRYVVTDMDMMEFCRTWMSGNGIPRNISECIKRRYLLFLGGSYNDWLFRFIWFSMRHSAQSNKETSMFVIPGKEDSNEDSFINFLDRLETFTQNDPEIVISEIERRLAAHALENNDNQQKTSEGTDVFISYSRSDKDIAYALYQELTSRGINVWFDQNSIGKADNWKQTISTGIHQTKLFVPLLTSNITNEILEEHEYRIEWDEAANIAKRLGGRAFIIPVAEFGFDFYDTSTNLPNQFKDLNATWFMSKEEISQVADVIVSKLNELKELKNKINNGK